MKEILHPKFMMLTLLALVLVSASFAAEWATFAVQNWGQSEINDDGNLRFRIDASASGFTLPSWFSLTCSGTDLQLWASIDGPASNPALRYQLIKSKDACNNSGQLVRSIMGTSARFKLSPGVYTYYLFVALNTGDTVVNPDGSPSSTVLALSDPPRLGGTVTLP